MYRVRIVFNAPLERAHPFCSVSKDTLEDAKQIIEDMKPALVHAASVQVQESTRNIGDMPTGWRIMPTWQWTNSPLSPS